MNLSIHLYSINSMFYPDFLKFYCPRILARIPDDISESHLGLILTITDSQTPLVLMILIVVRLCSLFPSWTLSHVVS